MKRCAIHFGREDGQAVILVVVAMSIFLMGALGLAIDGGQMYAQRQMAQAAADAAAQAGIMSIFKGTNATSAYPFGTGSPPIASSTCTTTDGRTPCVYARNNGFGGTTADTVTLSFPAAVSGVTLSSVTVPAFAVTVQRTLQTGLIRFVGAAATSTIAARATAGLVGTVSPYCIYALDPSAQNAFTVTNGSTLTLSGCAVAVDSTNNDALTVSGGSSLNASAIAVAGGGVVTGGSVVTAPATSVSGISVGGGSTMTPVAT
ncbi:MAG: pilus assembly protein TadG-related protein, partial [Bryobacteraceae bacterium]